MSIVSQILKDLEKRTPAPPRPAGVNPRVNSQQFSRSAKRINKFRKMILCLLLAAGTMLLLDVWVVTRHFFTGGNAAVSRAQMQIPVPRSPDLPLTAHTAAIDLSGMTIEVQGSVTQLRFLLSSPSLYRMTTNADGTVYRLILDNTRLKTDMAQLDYTGSAIRSLKMSQQQDGSLEVLFLLQKGVRMQQAGIFPGKSPEFLMNLVWSQPLPLSATIQATPPVVSRPRHQSDFQTDSLQMATKLASAGELDKAGSLLKSLLDISPGYHPAREALVQLLMQHSRITEAGMVLHAGLERYPQWLPYVSLEARWLAEQGKIRSALHVLSQQSPALSTHPEYYALMAALYQRQNQSLMAAKLYQQLIALQPDHGRWWLGYAIALDGMDKHAEAVSAYGKALQASGEELSPELKAWAETRMHTG